MRLQYHDESLTASGILSGALWRVGWPFLRLHVSVHV